MLQKIPVSALPAKLSEQIDLFICSASFEERSTVIPSHIDRSHIEHTIICANKVTFTPLIDKTASQLRTLFGERAIPAEISMENPLVTADQLQRAMSTLPNKSTMTYAVDVTSFTHEALLILLRVLQSRLKSSDKVIGLYNGATDYAVGLPPDEKWLTKGIGEIRSVLGYPGHLEPNQKTHLIVLVGFEMERAESIIAAFEPSRLSLGCGSPLESISIPLHKLNDRFFRKLSNKYKEVTEFNFSCEDALEAKASVEKQANSFSGYNVFVAPMNTKISTVGAALAAFENQAMQLCYATAEQYNFEVYSAPSDNCYIFEMPLLTPVAA